MKKHLFIFMMLVECALLSGCATVFQEKNDGREFQEKPAMTETNGDMSEIATSNRKFNEVPSPLSDNIDVDLTELSGTMVYAEVFSIMSNPDDYIGKTIKMNGPYSSSYYDKTDMYYHFVIIEDASACCQSGLEFIWSGEHASPDDYPKIGTKIEVAGVFGSYDELGGTYYYLAVDDIAVLQ